MVFIYLNYLVSAKIWLPDVKQHVTEIRIVWYLMTKIRDAEQAKRSEIVLDRRYERTYMKCIRFGLRSLLLMILPWSLLKAVPFWEDKIFLTELGSWNLSDISREIQLCPLFCWRWLSLKDQCNHEIFPKQACLISGCRAPIVHSERLHQVEGNLFPFLPDWTSQHCSTVGKLVH